MKLATYSEPGQSNTKVGIVVGDTIIDSGFAGSMIDLIAQWSDQRTSLQRLADAGTGQPLSSVKLHAPVERPGKIWAIGLNYADHVAESKMETPTKQLWFTKALTSINGPYDPILIAKGGTFVDYEVELVAIIGKRGKHIPADKAADHIFGYCVGNDVTERMWQHSGPQWSLGKSFDTHAPIGPWITTADEIADPHTLNISCSVNGQTRQSSNTKHLIFNIWQQIEHLSGAMTLEPGDVIFTGTPGGIGAAMDPRQFLREGDVVRCEVDRLGVIEGTLAGEA
ncbi:MAG: fumarylacetoacetate hydrolase family protein [Hyphomonas sp.]|uniref:fumarylacetoacetate hydrolase family protein n=1 Tax=Hyphomonas sp. TaxID=87 RepID=UPI0018399F20|nr:fumarylacetoacetate hydrolase family protein [Hyphomonas sp.]MBU3919969.1 fumarylacetoacetate hydrolase family protein [Alphaproteobacteria bacterium]MBA3067750.1 fumarylacetoacetate hydrolase family protein [Hyphomonas sp.]MBU4062162.1 fumarylacetoacetate hydrolase family protein [Alphaproteobacteria bacterium]MBU4165597.1 fumarylacetoacetate hydrolase family protein [Alphaproteobacteria bacterium]MBU4568710.1 fumarylacetoacetate hydrolase family protein [Alphaproteobacteria bacterium]